MIDSGKYPAHTSLILAEVAYKQAREHCARLTRELFPVGCKVRVTHHTGQYEGRVTGYWDAGNRVGVCNDKTGKVTKRYPTMDIDGVPCVVRIDGVPL